MSVWAGRFRKMGGFPRRSNATRPPCAMQPDAVMALINLGAIHEELGQMAEAEAAYRTAFRTLPDFGLAHARLGTLLRQLPDHDLAALKERSPIPKRPPRDAPGYSSLTASSLTPEAISQEQPESSSQANALNMEIARGPRAYTPEFTFKYVDSVMRGFNSGLLEQVAGGGSDDLRPVFVFGLPRSGTSLVEQVLSSHSQVFGAGELRVNPSVVRRDSNGSGIPGPRDRLHRTLDSAARSGDWPRST